MPIQEAPLKVFRTFICIKRIPPPPPPLFYYVPLSLSTSFPCLLIATLPTSASFYIRYLKALPLSVLSALLSRLSTRTRLFRFYTSFYPSSLYLSTLSPCTPAVLHHILLISPLCSSEELECLLYARISLLNLVLQVTILLLSPFSSRYFSCRYSTLLLFLVNAFVFVTERTSGTSPLFFCIR